MNAKDIAITLAPAGGWWQAKTQELVEQIVSKLIVKAEMTPVDAQELVGTLLIRVRQEYTARGEA